MMDDKRLERIEEKLDGTNAHLSSIDTTLSVQAIQLEEHIRRTALLEAELRPIRRHVDMMSGALKLIGLLAVLGGLYEVVKSTL